MIKIAVEGGHEVSGLPLVPQHPIAGYVMAHGAGAGMTHPFMAAMAEALAARDVATLRFQFPSMEKGSARPDRPPLAQATVRAAVDAARGLWPGLPLIAGGKSFGGRMTSQAQAEHPLPDVRGLVFLGFPLHPAGKPGVTRAEHLAQVQVPLLFLQGTRDALADMDLMKPCLRQLGPRASLVTIPEADHSFHVPVRSGRTDADVIDTMAETIAAWIAGHLRTG